MNMVFNIAAFGVLSSLHILAVSGQVNLGKCSPDWHICEATGECIPTLCQNAPSIPSSFPCGDGQTFCASAGACVPACPGKSAAYTRSERATTCAGELVFCMSTNSCMPPAQCGDSPNSQQCPLGTSFCLSTGQCQSTACGPIPSQSSCPLGTVFCPVTGKCQSKRCLSGLNSRQSRPTTFLVPLNNRCRSGKVLDIYTGKCVNAVNKYPVVEETAACIDGMVYDIATGTCVPAFDSKGKQQIEGSATPCNGEMVYCAATGECVEESKCGNDSESVVQKCRVGKVFCLATNACTWPNRCNVSSEAARSEELNGCPDGEVFCLSTDRCEAAGNCGSRTIRTYDAVICPRGYVYCIEKRDCALKEKGCGDAGTTLECEPGTVFCPDKGQCSADCNSNAVLWRPELQCPLENSTFNFSNCISGSHCPYGYNCCPDAVTLHQQCVGPNNTVASDVLNSISCPMLASSGENSDIGVTCLNSPSQCPPLSICCNGTCKTPRGTNQCPPMTLYCSLTKKCKTFGSTCGEVCLPGNVFCLTSGVCKLKSQCEFVSTSGSPWMLPGPVILTTSGFMNPAEQRLNYLFNINGTTVQDTNLQVINMLVGSGAFQTRKSETDPWTNVGIGSSFSTADYLQFIPANKSYNFGLAFLNVTEQDTGIPRLIVQLLTPEPPEIQFTLRDKWLTTVEDELQMMTLGELFSIVDTDWMYWDAWKKALGLPSQSAKLGLIDFTHPTTLAWVRSLTRPDFESKSRDGKSYKTSMNDSSSVKRGLKIEYGQEQPLADEPLIYLDVSDDGGRSWIPVNTVTPTVLYVSKTRSLADTLIRMSPAPNAYGNMSFLFTPLVQDSLSGSSSYVKDIQKKLSTQRLEVVILPMNDAPMAISGVNLSLVPSLNPSKTEIRMTANDLASIFYVDADGDSLGVAIFFAHSSLLGNWTYSDDNGATWKELTFSARNPLVNSGRLMSGRYQGLIMSELMDPLHSPQILASLTAPNPGFGIGPTMGPSVMQNNNISNFNGSEAPQKNNNSLYYEYSNDCEKVNTMVNALLLPPSTILKFKATNVTNPWTIADTIKNTRLIFTAWDTADVKVEALKVQRKNMSLTNCTPECGGSGSYGDVPASILADWKGCDGSEILDGTIKVIDRCGVCGGDGQSCVDCHFVVNGTARLDCGQCIGGTTGIASVRDCAGECGSSNILKLISGRQVCVSKSAADLLPCDNTTDSGAYINECGICVGGTTNQTKDASKDQCGICFGLNVCVGCDGVPFSGKVNDLCGHCLAENDTNFNKGCSTIGNFNPVTEDVAMVDANAITMESAAEFINPDLAIKGTVVGISPSQYKLDNCSFLNSVSNQTITNSHANFMNGMLQLSIMTLKVGLWNVTCNFEAVNASQTESSNLTASKLISIQSSTPLKVVNSTSVAIEAVDKSQISPQNDSEISVKLRNSVDLSDAYCILIYQALANRTRFVTKLHKLRTHDGDNITCNINPSVRIGSPSLSVVLADALFDAVKSNKINLPSVPVQILAVSPKVISSTLSSMGATLVIRFDINIEINNNCFDNFADKTIFGQAPSCQYHSSEILILLGSQNSVNNGTILTFSQPNGIIQKYGNYQAPGATGSTVVLQDVVKEMLTFTIVGDNSFCNGSIVKLDAILDQIPNAQNYKVMWNISTLANKDNLYDSNEALINNSIKEIRTIADNLTNSTSLVFPGSLLVRNVTYLIIAKLQGPMDNMIEPQKFALKAAPEDAAFVVNIKGSRNAYVDKIYTYQADIKYCKQRLIQNIYRDSTYFWGIDKIANALPVGITSQSLELQPGTLRANNNYTLTSLIVDVDEESGLGTLDIKTLPQKVKAIIATQHMTVGSSSSFVLDGSNSLNPSGPTSDLNFRWRCDKIDGTKCFSSQSMQRFENAIPLETLLSQALIVPPILPPNTYVFTLEASNAESSSNASTTVKILPGIMPQLFVRAPPGLVDVTQTLNIYGFVTSPPVVKLKWECVDEVGYEFADIYGVATAAQEITTMGSSNFRPLTLTIPQPSGSWPGLKPGSRYKFRLVATLNGGPASQADAVIQTKSPPTPGSFVVTPMTGQALVTNFSLSAAGWVDSPEDLPLTATFGYKVADTGKIVWIDKKVGSNLALQTVFTANSPTTKIIPLLMICDTTLACSNVEGSEVTISLPNNLPDKTLIQISEGISSQLGDDSKILSTLAHSGEVLATLQSLHATAQLQSLVDILEFQMSSKLESLKDRLSSDPTNVLTQQTAKDMLSGSLNILREGYPFSINIFYSLVSLSDNLIAALTNVPPPKPGLATPNFPPLRKTASDNIIFPDSVEHLDSAKTVNNIGSRRPGIQFYPQEDNPNASTRRSPSLPATSRIKQAIKSIALGHFDPPSPKPRRSLPDEQSEMSSPAKDSHRVKRQSQSTNSPSVNFTALTVDEVRNYMTIDETNILNAQTQSNKTVAMDKLSRNIDVYIAGLCLSMTTEDPPQEVHGNLVSLRVSKSQLLKNEDVQRYPIANASARTQDFVKETSYIVWGPIIGQYKQWICDPSDSTTSCYGICMCTIEYDSLFAAPYVRATVPGRQRGHLIRTALLHPTKGYEIKPPPSANPLSLSLAISNTSVGENEVLKCFGWSNDQWNGSICNTNYLRSTSTSYYSCGCRNTGYTNTFVIGVGKEQVSAADGSTSTNLTPLGTPSPTMYPPSIYIIRNITMKLDGNYNVSVRGREAHFIDEITNQVAVKLNLTARNIRILNVRPGSIVVDMQLVENNATRISGVPSSIDSVYAYLVEAINSGDMVFTGLDSEQLRVLPSDTTSAALGQPYLPILIGGIVGGVLMIAIVIMVLAYYLNKKKRMEKVSPINAVNLPPTYRAIHFEQSLKGNSYPRKNQSANSWDPNMAAYTEDGLYIERNAALKDSKPNSGISDDTVPEAFHYRSPTKQQLENSGPIPEHILEQLKKTSVPGTPDNDIH